MRESSTLPPLAKPRSLTELTYSALCVPKLTVARTLAFMNDMLPNDVRGDFAPAVPSTWDLYGFCMRGSRAVVYILWV